MRLKSFVYLCDLISASLTFSSFLNENRELKALLEHLQWDTSPAAVEEAKKALDGDGNGTIDFEEFLT